MSEGKTRTTKKENTRDSSENTSNGLHGNIRDRVVIRKAEIKDQYAITKYLDKYLRRDWFETKKRLLTFLKIYNCHLAYDGDKLIGFSVVQNNGLMIRLLIIPEYRGMGIGGMMLQESKPQIIRSKTDQSTGDPSAFYEKYGYVAQGKKIGRKKNIQLMIKKL